MMGRMVARYSLLFAGILRVDFLPMRFCSLILFIFAFLTVSEICGFHVNLLFSLTPRYLMVLQISTASLKMRIGGPIGRLVWFRRTISSCECVYFKNASL